MLFDARTLQPGTRLDADIAIVGGGLCGLTLAAELARDSRLRILILESGGTEPEQATEQLNHGTACIHDPFGNVRQFDAHVHESRCRCLGGSGHLWGGKCAELDPIDFETRRWIEHSGWPFDYEHLRPYLQRACNVLQLPVFDRRAVVQSDAPRAPLLINQERTLTTGLRRFSAIAGRAPANRFSQFVAGIAELPNVSIYLHATVVDLPLAAGTRLARLTVRTAAEADCSVHADSYVLAAGGLENARLLLAAGHGTANERVGRYFMGHVIYRRTHAATAEGAIAEVDGAENCLIPQVDPARLALYIDKDPTQLQGVLQLTRNAQKRERLPNCSLTLEPPARPGAALPCYLMLEQRPSPDSRLLLTAQHDALGMPRLHLDWRFTPADFADLQRAAAVFAAELRQHGVGELRYRIEPRELLPLIETARHHMGTTRMHTSRTEGVVDEHCRVHDIDNLHVAGTSIFPTGGIGNPTLTLLALTLRLAEHLRALLRQQPAASSPPEARAAP